MGVKELWPILGPVKTAKLFGDMKGETVAVDLSLWIVDSQCVKQMVGTVTRPHLRNLFFRTAALLQAGILPVFVVDGDAPELKWQTVADRNERRQGRAAAVTGPSRKPNPRQANRTQFKKVIKECCEMLDYLGVPYIQSSGEAEATCAALNKQGLVDAVVTEDGDAFLYGARTVYRNFTTTKTPGVDSYSMSDIERNVQLSKNHLIAIALLIGCDYCPKGVPGIGRTQAIKLCVETSADSILKKIVSWSKTGPLGNESPAEKPIAVKICKAGSTKFDEIIEEFMNISCRVPSRIGSWKKPLLLKAQEFNEVKMEWPVNYSLEKLLPLLTLWSLRAVMESRMSASDLSIQPQEIVKKRVRQGRDCLEILWAVTDPYQVDDGDDKKVSLTTIESLAFALKCFPSQVQVFLDIKAAKSKKSTKRTIPSKPCASTEAASTDRVIESLDAASIFSHGSTNPQQGLRHSPLATSPSTSGSLEQCANYAGLSDIAVSSSTLGTEKNALLTDNGVQEDFSLTDTFGTQLDGHRSRYNTADIGSSQVYNTTFSSLINTDVLESSNESRLTRSSILSIVSINDSLSCSGEMTKTSREPHLPGSEVSSPRNISKRNSIDMLLADISDQLKTPHGNASIGRSDVNIPVDCEHFLAVLDGEQESIITGYATPGISKPGRNHSRSPDGIENGKTDLFETTVPLFDVKTRATFSESELSLFSVDDSSHGDNGDLSGDLSASCADKRDSITGSTPLSERGQPSYSITQGSDVKFGHGGITYGEFDVIPQFSALSFDD